MIQIILDLKKLNRFYKKRKFEVKMHNNLSHINEWTVPELFIDSYKLKIISVYCALLFIVSIISNPTLIWILLRNKELISPANALILPIAVLSIFGALFELPIVSLSSFYYKLV